MLVSPTTTPWIIFWQFLNQSYNMGMNYFNRNASNPLTNQQVFNNYMAATGLSCGVGVGAKLLTSSALVSPSRLKRTLARGFIPLAGTLAASLLNVFLTRKDEVLNGVAVRSSPRGDGEVVGRSKLAGRKGVELTMYSRSLLPLPTFLLAPVFISAVTRRFHFRSKFLLMGVKGSIVSVFLAISLPLSLAPWPLWVPLNKKDLEPELADLKCNTVFINRGL
uniref:Uncharacterized protein n=1 Tax=Stereomyxa ramosa TaxID=1078864 RepID=A0A7S2ABL6_9EUKA|mmetsp:Transcript_370/g.435  ORF Transcript_370/g.435 Transcript_370/m.435 type:complete len:221 (+) Transcript_370:263-925(+)